MTISPAKNDSKAAALWVPALLFAAAFTLFIHTANPLFRFSDGGELAAASHTLGVAHPTGYPLFLMGQKLWSFLLPIGNPCFRANVFSAACASAALVIVYLLCFEFAGALAGLVAAGLLAFSQTFWLQATQSTVYTLNLMLAALLMLLAFRVLGPMSAASGPPAMQNNSSSAFILHPSSFILPSGGRSIRRTTALFFFVLGLGLCNHITLALVPAALLLSHPRRIGRLLRSRGIAMAAMLFLLAGLLVYLYLPVRASTKPSINWGNPSISERLWQHVSEPDYKFKQASRSLSEHITVTKAFLGSLVRELGIAGVALALIGLVGGLFRRRGRTFFFLLIAFGTLLVALLYGEGTYLEPAYCLPAYMAAAVLAGLGAAEVVLIFAGRRDLSQTAPRKKLALVVSIVLIVLPIRLLASNYHRCDSSRNYYAYWHGLNLLKTMPLGSTFFGETDKALFPLYYLKFVEGRRPDVNLYDRKWRVIKYFDQNDPQASYNREMRIIENSRDAPVFYAEYPSVPAINIKLFGILLEAFLTEPLTGTIDFQRLYSNFLVEPEKDIYIDKWTREARAKYFLLWGHQCQLQGNLAAARLHFEEARRLGFENANLMNNLSIYFQRAGMADQAVSSVQRAVTLRPNSAAFLTRLGLLYYKLKRFEEATAALERALAIDGQNPDATIYLGNAFMFKGDLANAKMYFEKTLKIMPHNIQAHNNLGFIYKRQAKYDDAADHFKEAVRIGTHSYLPYFNLARVYALKGDADNALKWLRRGRRYMTKDIVESIREQKDFDSIRDDPRFDRILSAGD